MTDRFSPASIFTGHVKGLLARDPRDSSKTSLDGVALVVMIAVPVGAAAVVGLGGFTLGDPGFLAGAAALLTAGLLGTFAQLASWRDRLTATAKKFPRAERPLRYNVDTAVAHVSVASYLSIVLTVILVIGSNSVDGHGNIVGLAAVLAAAVGSYLVLLLLILIPALYEAYAEVNDLPDDVSGLSALWGRGIDSEDDD